MPSKLITDAFVRNVRFPKKSDKPNQVTYIHTHWSVRAWGLMLVVSYGGGRTFSVLTYRDGKPLTRKIGNYPRYVCQGRSRKSA